MLRFESLPSSLQVRAARGVLPVLFLLAVVSSLASPAGAQDFTLTMDNFFPFAVNPGGQANANLTLNPVGGFNGAVTLGCSVTTTATVTTLPMCVVSPSTVTPPGTATAIVTTLDPNTQTAADPASYTITVTASGGSTNTQASKDLSVLAVTADYTISVTNVVAPSSVVAGNSAQATIAVNPLNGYSGVVTLACSSINPVADNPPVCTFAYPSGQYGLTVNGVQTTTTLTITTDGPLPTTGAVKHDRFYAAFWLPVPVLALFGVAAAGKGRSSKALGLIGLFLVTGSFLLIPACSSNSTSNSNNPTGAVTPSNTYTFTLTGVDQNGIVSSNTGTTNTSPTVQLTVTAPK